MVDLARQNWRDYAVDGVAASGKYKPNKAKIRQWGTWVESVITAFTSNGGLVYATRALLYADLLHGANTSAWVVSDSTGAYNGIYQKSGASGAGAWSRVADLPYSFISCTDAGAGTANAIVATSSIPAPTTAGMALFVSNVYEANTGAVTYSLNGAAAKPVITNSGNALSSGYLTAGMHVLFFDDGTNYRLLTDVASAAIQAAAEAAQAAAEAAQALAEAAAAGGEVSLDGVETLTNKTLTQPVIVLKQSAAPTPTAEGDMQWDTDDNVLVIGTGAAQEIFAALPASTAIGDILYLSGPKSLFRLAKGAAKQVLRQNSALTAPEWAPAREMLTAARTYYVATTGNNANDGLSAGSPFLTIQKALDVVFGTLDLGGFDVTIQLADGTYWAGFSESSPQVGAGLITINGNSTTPANVIISATNASACSVQGGAQVKIQNLELRITTSGRCISSSGGGSVIFIGVGIRFGTCAGFHIVAEYGGLVRVDANYSIVGAALSHWVISSSASLSCTSKTITITGTPAFSTAFLVMEALGTAQIFWNTFSGTATGVRYIISYNAYAHTNGAGATYLPGSSAGYTSNGGLYR